MEKVPGPLEREAGCSHHEQVQVVGEGVTIKEVFREFFLRLYATIWQAAEPLWISRGHKIFFDSIFQDLNINCYLTK